MKKITKKDIIDELKKLPFYMQPKNMNGRSKDELILILIEAYRIRNKEGTQ